MLLERLKQVAKNLLSSENIRRSSNSVQSMAKFGIINLGLDVLKFKLTRILTFRLTDPDPNKRHTLLNFAFYLILLCLFRVAYGSGS
jgi:hypothetical protein